MSLLDLEEYLITRGLVFGEVLHFVFKNAKAVVFLLFFLLWCLGLWQGSLEASLGVGWGGLWDGLGCLLDVRFWLVVDATIALAGFALSSSLCELSFPFSKRKK